MPKKSFTFDPPLLGTMSMLVALAIFLTLGFWQLQRANEKKVLLKQYQTLSTEAPMLFKDFLKKNQVQAGRKLKVSGVYLNDKQFLLDNRFSNHRVGYHVLTPMQINGANQVLIVDRGWVPQGRTRAELPSLIPVMEPQNFVGTVYLPSSKQRVLGSAEDNPRQWPRVIQRLDLPAIAKRLNQSVYPFILRLDPNSPNGFVRNWKVVNAKPQKHIGYAIQWFAFAIVLLIIYIGLNLKREGAQSDHEHTK